MRKSKNGSGNGAKAPAEAQRFILKSQITPEVINDIHVKSELGRYRMRGFSVQEDPALGRFDLPARHADALRH
jgi:hypothetical protein